MREMCAILHMWENHRAKGGFTSLVYAECIKALRTKFCAAEYCRFFPA